MQSHQTPLTNVLRTMGLSACGFQSRCYPRPLFALSHSTAHQLSHSSALSSNEGSATADAWLPVAALSETLERRPAGATSESTRTAPARKRSWERLHQRVRRAHRMWSRSPASSSSPTKRASTQEQRVSPSDVSAVQNWARGHGTVFKAGRPAYHRLQAFRSRRRAAGSPHRPHMRHRR